MEPKELLKQAHEAGYAAGLAAAPEPMTVVGEQEEYYVPDGICGFAWVNIKPARGKLVTYLKKQGIGHKSYYGGYDIWVSDHNQSYDRKMAHAYAMAEVLKENGVNASPQGRVD